MCVVLERRKEMLKLGCEAGTLNTMFPFSIYDKSDFPGFSVANVKEGEIGVREAVKFLSVGNGQGVLKCNCKTGKCNKACTCFKANQKCNSRCHGGHDNKNCVNKILQ